MLPRFRLISSHLWILCRCRIQKIMPSFVDDRFWLLSSLNFRPLLDTQITLNQHASRWRRLMREQRRRGNASFRGPHESIRAMRERDCVVTGLWRAWSLHRRWGGEIEAEAEYDDCSGGSSDGWPGDRDALLWGGIAVPGGGGGPPVCFVRASSQSIPMIRCFHSQPQLFYWSHNNHPP